MQVFYSLISLDVTFYPLVTGPVNSCAISTPRGAYSTAAVSAHWTYRTHCHLCPTRYSFSPESSEAFEGEVPCPRTQHLNNVPRLRGEKHDISLKILHQAGFETARQAVTSAERHALTIALCPSLLMFFFINIGRNWVRHVTRANTGRRWPNIGLMFVHRVRRWPSIEPVSACRIVFDGIDGGIVPRNRVTWVLVG